MPVSSVLLALSFKYLYVNMRICCLCPFSHKLFNLYSAFYSKGSFCLGDVRGRNEVCNLDSLQQRMVEVWTGLRLAKNPQHLDKLCFSFSRFLSVGLKLQ